MTRNKHNRYYVARNSSWDAADEEDELDEERSILTPGRLYQQPQQRNAANARERARMRVLSKAFCRLKTTLPWVPADTKLSKLDTLRLATSYIAHLRAILHLSDEGATQEHSHPINLSWPFSNNFCFQNKIFKNMPKMDCCDKTKPEAQEEDNEEENTSYASCKEPIYYSGQHKRHSSKRRRCFCRKLCH